MTNHISYAALNGFKAKFFHSYGDNNFLAYISTGDGFGCMFISGDGDHPDSYDKRGQKIIWSNFCSFYFEPYEE